MIRWSLFLAIAAGLVAYSFWLYLRVELPVRWAPRLAAMRAGALVLLLVLLFDVRLPAVGPGGRAEQWALLDASLSMGAAAAGGGSAWDEASSRAADLRGEGWTVVTFGAGTELTRRGDERAPEGLRTLLTPALERAAEAGVRRVRVLSDMRLEDAVAARSALASLPLEVDFERFGDVLVNAGISRLEVPDLARLDGSVTAEVEIHAVGVDDSLTIRVFEEERPVAQVRVAAPSPGLRARVSVALPTPLANGRVRYTAVVTTQGDAFPSDDEAVSYPSVGHEEGALVLLSLQPDWEPRYLLPVLEEVTGLPAIGYVRGGADTFVPMGRAADRGAPVDSASVGRAAADAAILVLHGVGAGADAWARSLAGRPGRNVLLVADAEGAALAGIPSGSAQTGEWYASGDIPSSPIAGALAGVTLQALPPLTDVILPTDPAQVRGALLVQLRGAGAPEAALHLDDRPGGRVAVVLASGFWRWAARENGQEAYRRLWSGVAGWLLAGQAVGRMEPRPVEWVVARGEPVTWSVPVDSLGKHLVVSLADSVVVDTTLTGGGTLSTGVLPPGTYSYRVEGVDEEALGSGRFDVAEATLEMAPASELPAASTGPLLTAGGAGERAGRPLRTHPWPYLLVILLLCSEWIGRRRSGLR